MWAIAYKFTLAAFFLCVIAFHVHKYLFEQYQKQKDSLTYSFYPILLTIIVAWVSIMIGIFFSHQTSLQSTKAIRETLFPNDFLVDLYIIDRESKEEETVASGFKPAVRKTPFYYIKIPSRKIKIHARIANNTNFPANFVSISFHYEKAKFQESLAELYDQINSNRIYGNTARQSAPIDLIDMKSGKKENIFEGIKIIFDQLPPINTDKPDVPNYFSFKSINLTLLESEDYAFFVVKVRGNIFPFQLHLKPLKKQPQLKLYFYDSGVQVKPLPPF